MTESSAGPAGTRLTSLVVNPEIVSDTGVDQLYDDLATVDAALVAFRDRMEHTDEKSAEVDAVLAGLRREADIGCITNDFHIDDHQGAHEWRQKRKSAAIQALKPALVLLGEPTANEAT